MSHAVPDDTFRPRPRLLSRRLGHWSETVFGGLGRKEPLANPSEVLETAGRDAGLYDEMLRTESSLSAAIALRTDKAAAHGSGFVAGAGDRAEPLRMVAEATGLHESTASRVTSNKYIATERGIFELKFFFTNAVGREGLAAAAVRHQIRALIDAEGPGGILSGDTIVVQLQEDGIDIARRTVAKYRRVPGRPSSVGPRRLQAMMAED